MNMTGNLAKQAIAAAYILLNVLSGTTIVFLNKAVFSIFGFSFIYALACERPATFCSQTLHWGLAGVLTGCRCVSCECLQPHSTLVARWLELC